MRFFKIQKVKMKNRADKNQAKLCLSEEGNLDKSQVRLCLKEKNRILKPQNFVIREFEIEC